VMRSDIVGTNLRDALGLTPTQVNTQAWHVIY